MARATSILSYFPKALTPRQVQSDSLKLLEQRWDLADIHVVNLSVASGKSAVAMTLSKWRKDGASVIVPNKLLVEQYREEYHKQISVLKGKADYFCKTYYCKLSMRPTGKKVLTMTECSQVNKCQGCGQYLLDLRRAKSSRTKCTVTNFHVYMAYKLYKDTLIVDEAHNLIDFIKNMHAKKYWQHHHYFPDDIRSRYEVTQWVNSLDERALNYKDLWKLKEEVNNPRPSFLVHVTEDKFRGEAVKAISMEPLDVSSAPPTVWPASVKKIILLSATVSRKDIEQLGLSNKRVNYIQADSPIEASRRPVIIPAERKSMAFRNQEKNIPALIDFISYLADAHPDAKGLVHATYGLAKLIQRAAIPPELRSRLIFHDKKNKSAKYKDFRETADNKILVASGMYEGIDLPYDAGRWQVIAKVPYPSLADPAIKYLQEQDNEWYAWQTIKSLLQACGRICRTPTDYGESYVFDDSFIRLYRSNPDLWPNWFKQSVTIL